MKRMLDTCISDNARLGIPNIGIKGNIMADGAATPYDSGSPMQDNGYLGSPDYGASFSPIVQSGGATPGGFTEYQPPGFGGGLSPYSSRSPGGYSPSSPFNSISPSSPFSTSPINTSPGYSPSSPGGAYASPASPAWLPSLTSEVPSVSLFKDIH